jgi:YHS domain-containing protein
MRTFLIAMTSLLMSFALVQAAPINQFCPVMMEEKIDPEITTIHKGKTMAFCCDRCLAKFRSEPEKYTSRLSHLASLQDDPQNSVGGKSAGIHENNAERRSADQHDFAFAHLHGQASDHRSAPGEACSGLKLIGKSAKQLCSIATPCAAMHTGQCCRLC